MCVCVRRLRRPTRKMRLQWPHVTLHMPGEVGAVGLGGAGVRLMMRLQVLRGQAMRCDRFLHINKQLQGHRTYFLPPGAFLMGCGNDTALSWLVP